MTAGQKKTLSVNAVNGKGDTIQFTSSNKSVVKVNKASATATAKKVASTTVTALKAGTAKITAKSKYTGKSKTFTIKVAAATVTPAPEVTTNPAVVATTPAATATVTNGPSVPGGNATDAPQTTSGAATNAPGTSANPDETKNPDATGTPSATDVVSTDAPTTEVPATEAPVPTKTPDVTTGSGVTTEAGLKVTGVTNVSTTKVTVEFEKLDADVTNATINIVDDQGNKIEVYAKDLVKNDSSATFTFTRAFTDIKQIKGIWYVDGVAYNVTVVNALYTVYTATANQIDLLDALKALELTDVVEDNIKLYQDAAKELADKYASASQLTVAIVQDMVNQVNKEAVTEADCIKAIKAIKSSKTQITLLSALQTAGVFERVNPDWIAEYDNAITDTVKTGLNENASDISTEVKKIQDLINGVNATHFTITEQSNYFGSEVASTAGGEYCLNKEKIEEYKGIVSKYMVPDTTTVTTKATLLQKLDAQIAICNVNTAETPAQLSIAITALKAVDSAYVLNMENYVDDNRTEYVKAIYGNSTVYGFTAGKDKDTIVEINAIFEAVNEAVALKPIANMVTYAKTISTNATKDQTEDLYKALSKISGLNNLVKENAGFYANCAAATDTYGVASNSSSNSAGTEDYSAALAALKLLDIGDGASDAASSVNVLTAQIQRIIDMANLQAIIAQADMATVNGDKLYAALTNYGNGLKDLSSENIDLYKGAIAASALAALTADNTTWQSANYPAAGNSETFNTDALKKGYIDALKNTDLKADVDAIQAIIDEANVDAVQATTTAEACLAKLNIITQLKNVKAENAKSYFAGSPSSGIYASGVTNVVELDAALDVINVAEAKVAYVKALNSAKTAEETRTALTNLALEFNGVDLDGGSGLDPVNVDAYINLTNADKLLVADMFMNDDSFGASDKLVTAARKAKFGAYDEASTNVDATIKTNIEGDLIGIVTAVNANVTALNTLFYTGGASVTPTIKEVQDELSKLVLTGYKKFDKLTASQKLQVTEAFIAAYPVDDKKAHIENAYKSLSAVEEAVDAAIASVVK